jgi:hypothetical protein
MAEGQGDPQGQSPIITTDPPEGGQSTQDQLPEKFKGKSAQEIAQSYAELEKQLGKHATEASQTKAEAVKATQQLQQWEALGKVIQGNPALYYQIENEIKNLGQSKPLNQQPDPTIAKIERDLTDTKLATQNQVFDKFESKFGITELSKEDQDSLKQKIGKELSEMTGAKDVESAIAGLSLDRLPVFLEKAYRLATDSDDNERARLKGMLDAKRNNQASFGNVPSSSIRENPNGLSPEEKRVAKKLGIAEDKYLKSKQQQYN